MNFESQLMTIQLRQAGEKSAIDSMLSAWESVVKRNGTESFSLMDTGKLQALVENWLQSTNEIKNLCQQEVKRQQEDEEAAVRKYRCVKLCLGACVLKAIHIGAAVENVLTGGSMGYELYEKLHGESSASFYSIVITLTAVAVNSLVLFLVFARHSAKKAVHHEHLHRKQVEDANKLLGFARACKDYESTKNEANLFASLERYKDLSTTDYRDKVPAQRVMARFAAEALPTETVGRQNMLELFAIDERIAQVASESLASSTEGEQKMKADPDALLREYEANKRKVIASLAQGGSGERVNFALLGLAPWSKGEGGGLVRRMSDSRITIASSDEVHTIKRQRLESAKNRAQTAASPLSPQQFVSPNLRDDVELFGVL